MGGVNLKLIVHIGAGKTGSSSIQATLNQSRLELLERGIAYLGLMLEYAEQKEFPWQHTGGSDEFFARKNSDVAAEEIYQVLSKTLPALQSRGVSHAIWSNEWMFGRDKNVLPALARLKAEGWDITVVCYVRRHDRWVKSSYIQWGIKYKTYPGAMRPFKEWKKGRSFSLYIPVKPWHEAFGNKCALFNFDAIANVTTHFLSLWSDGLKDIPEVRENESPSLSTLAIWSVFNSRFLERVEESRFVQVARPSKILDRQARLPTIEEMLPDAEDLRKIATEYAEDFSKINELLVRQGRPPLLLEEAGYKEEKVDEWEMQVQMMRMLLSMQEQILDLQKRLLELNERSGNSGSPGASGQ